MTDTIEAPQTESTETEDKRARLPKTIADVQAITHIPTTEATTSFGNFINKYLTNADNFDGITPEQAWTVIGVHRVWQQSDERKAEIEALKVAKAQEFEEKAKAREEAKAKREEEKEAKAKERAEKKAAADKAKAEKAEEKARKEAEKKAKADDSDSDLDSADVEGDGEIKPSTSKRRRRPAAPAEDATEAEATEDQPVDGF